MSDLPDPLVPPDTDVRNLDGFMLNVERLIASELLALSTGDEFKAAVCLWCRAWKQLPAGSLPDDERILAAFSGAGKDWPHVRDMAMRGFIKCSDGRWYHKTLCADALRAAAKKRERDERTKAATEARKQQRHGQRDDDRHVDNDDDVTNSHRRDETGQGQDKTGQDDSIVPLASRAGKKYAFEGKIIKLNQADYETWKAVYSAIPDLKAELSSIDIHYQRKGGENWFQRTSFSLNKKHQEILINNPPVQPKAAKQDMASRQASVMTMPYDE